MQLIKHKRVFFSFAVTPPDTTCRQKKPWAGLSFLTNWKLTIVLLGTSSLYWQLSDHKCVRRENLPLSYYGKRDLWRERQSLAVYTLYPLVCNCSHNAFDKRIHWSQLLMMMVFTFFNPPVNPESQFIMAVRFWINLYLITFTAKTIWEMFLSTQGPL